MRVGVLGIRLDLQAVPHSSEVTSAFLLCLRASRFSGRSRRLLLKFVQWFYLIQCHLHIDLCPAISPRWTITSIAVS